MKNTDKNTSASLKLGFNVLEALMGFAARGAKNIELATAVNTSPANITRIMGVMIAKGWARKGENGRFYPHPNFAGLAMAALNDFDQMQRDLENRKLDLLSDPRKQLN